MTIINRLDSFSIIIRILCSRFTVANRKRNGFYRAYAMEIHKSTMYLYQMKQMN